MKVEVMTQEDKHASPALRETGLEGAFVLSIGLYKT
jgi:hypothetical protein